MDFRDAVFDTIRSIMREDADVVVATNDMGAMILDEIRAEMPERVINVGIAEQNLMAVSGGLALAGKKVYVFGISAHLVGRSLEHIKLDICVGNLPVVILGVGPGLAYGADGPTHHGTEDVAIMRALPNMTIFNPCDGISTAALVRAAYDLGSPAYVRVDKENIQPIYSPTDDFDCGFKIWQEGTDVTVLSTGVLTFQALAAAETLASEGVSVRVVDVFRLKPLDEGKLIDVMKESGAVLVCEEHTPNGGLASAIGNIIAQSRLNPKFRAATLPDVYLLGSASRAWAHDKFGLTSGDLAKLLRSLV
ncbi:MAG: hypothetical protein HN403_11900 [Rhodospirillales bacterium]|jgi:transketolase|nr:hypothetical protein [Rhodospirillales bacterium]